MKQNRSACPITTTLDILGDRWTLVLVRDMLMGKKRFSDFLESPERITTNILTDRLVLMEGAGLVTKQLYQSRPKRFEYILTEKGQHLLPILQEMGRWANRFIDDTWVPPKAFMQTKP